MDHEPSLIIQLIIILLLIVVNAFLVMTEMAIISTNKYNLNDLAENGNKKAKGLLKLMDDPNKFLSTIQVGLTLAGFLSSALAASNLSNPLSKWFYSVGIAITPNVALILITLILSYITLVFGELIPKRIALQNAEKIALATTGIVSVIGKVISPFVKILSLSTNFFLRMFGIDTKKVEEQVTEGQIKQLLDVGTKGGLINEEGKGMIESVFLFDDRLAKDVMTPRNNVFFIDIDTPFNEYSNEYFENMYSRVPVYKDEVDNIVGILYMKDLLLEAHKNGFDNIDVAELMQKPFLTSERKNIDALFKDFQEKETHIAILYDEYGVLVGIVTMEDLIEEIFGEIEDEYDEEEHEVVKLNDHTYLVKGYTSIIDLNEELGLDLDENKEEYDTIAGLIIEQLGDLPENMEEKDVHFENLDLHIEKASGNKIDLVRVTVNEKEDNEEQEQEEQESA